MSDSLQMFCTLINLKGKIVMIMISKHLPFHGQWLDIDFDSIQIWPFAKAWLQVPFKVAQRYFVQTRRFALYKP